MKVAFDARSLASPVLRGWDRYTIGLARALRERGVDVTLLCREREPVHIPHAVAAASNVRPLPDRGGLWWEQVALRRAIADYDLYHAPAEHGVPLHAGRPVVLTIHSMTAHSYADFIARGLLPGPLRTYLGTDLDPHAFTPANFYWNAQVRAASAILVPSEFARREVIAAGQRLGIGEDRVTTTPLAVDDAFRVPPTRREALDLLLPALDIRRPYLLYVGGYEPHKNVPGLLAMFADLKRRRADLQLVLVGSRPVTPAMLEERTRLGLRPGDDVLFLHGHSTDLPALYDGAELCVSLSWRESFGLPALEAMTRGTAVVASAWGAAPEVVSDGGLLVDPRDPAAAAAATLRLLDDRGRGDRARAAAKRFSWDVTADVTLAVYRRLLGR